jgi:hypothetical protein
MVQGTENFKNTSRDLQIFVIWPRGLLNANFDANWKLFIIFFEHPFTIGVPCPFKSFHHEECTHFHLYEISWKYDESQISFLRVKKSLSKLHEILILNFDPQIRKHKSKWQGVIKIFPCESAHIKQPGSYTMKFPDIYIISSWEQFTRQTTETTQGNQKLLTKKSKSELNTHAYRSKIRIIISIRDPHFHATHNE